jgi:hypothetical protein
MSLSPVVERERYRPEGWWKMKQEKQQRRREEEMELVEKFITDWVKHVCRKDNELGYRCHYNKARKIIRHALEQCRNDFKKLDRNFKWVFSDKFIQGGPWQYMYHL